MSYSNHNTETDTVLSILTTNSPAGPPQEPGPGRHPGVPHIRVGHPGIPHIRARHPGVTFSRAGHQGVPHSRAGHPGVTNSRAGHPGVTLSRAGHPGVSQSRVLDARALLVQGGWDHRDQRPGNRSPDQLLAAWQSWRRGVGGGA
jgi:hypothetical protein